MYFPARYASFGGYFGNRLRYIRLDLGNDTSAVNAAKRALVTPKATHPMLQKVHSEDVAVFCKPPPPDPRYSEPALSFSSTPWCLACHNAPVQTDSPVQSAQVRKGDEGRRSSTSTFFSSDDSPGATRPGLDTRALAAFEKLGGFTAMCRQLELHTTCQAVCDALMGMILGVWGSKHEPIREKDVMAIKGTKESWVRCVRPSHGGAADCLRTIRRHSCRPKRVQDLIAFCPPALRHFHSARYLRVRGMYVAKDVAIASGAAINRIGEKLLHACLSATSLCAG